MYHAEALPSISPASFVPAAFQSIALPAGKSMSSEPMFEVTLSTVRMNGSELWRELFEVALGQIIEAISLAELRGKSELLITDITPWVQLGKDDTSEVPATQDRIEEIVVEACARLKRDVPETRLNLRGGSFDIRCYLGPEKPSDHVFEKDLASDTR